MKRLALRLAADDHGSVHYLYALGLLVIAAVTQPALVKAVFYRLEDLLRLFMGQLAALL